MSDTDARPPGRENRTVLAPQTRHERTRNLRVFADGAHEQRGVLVGERSLRRPWPDRVQLAVTPVGEVHDRCPDRVRVIVSDPRAAFEVSQVAFDLSSCEDAAFVAWRRAAPCPTPAPHRTHAPQEALTSPVALAGRSGPGHHWEPRGLRNGAGTCAGCGLFAAGVLDLASLGSLCVVCAAPTWHSFVKSFPGAQECETVDQPRLVCAECAPEDAVTLVDSLIETVGRHYHPRSGAATSGAAVMRRHGWLRGWVSASDFDSLIELVEADSAPTRPDCAGDQRRRLREQKLAMRALLVDRISDARAAVVDHAIGARTATPEP